MSEIERIRAEHVQDGDPGDPHCAMCSDASYPIWPCDAAILQALVSEQAREIARLKLTTRSDREYAEQKQRAEEAEAEVARLRESIVRAGRVHPDGGLCWCGVVTPHHWTGCALVRAALAARGGEVQG